MRRIEKSTEPACLVDLRNTPGADWSSVHGDQKQQMREAAHAEQGGLCAYCQSRLSGNHAADPRKPAAGGMTIEHWSARSADDGDGLFDWQNLLGVCSGLSVSKTSETERHCDTARGNRPLHVHPARHPPDAGRLFDYTARGEVRPASDLEQTLGEQVARDIEVLGLDTPRLRANRRAALEPIRNQLSSSKSSKSYAREVRKLYERYRNPGPALQPFHQVIVLYLEKKVRQAQAR